MALSDFGRKQLSEQLEKRHKDEVSELNKIRTETRAKNVQQTRIQNLEEERRLALNQATIHEPSESEQMMKMYQTDENLAIEMAELKREEIREQRMRQMLRESSPELRQLESKLRAAYVSKELNAQIAEKEARRLHHKMMEKHTYQVMLNNWIDAKEKKRIEAEETIRRKHAYKIELQDQMIINEKRKRYNYEEFLTEKRMIDEIVQRIHEEDQQALEEKACWKQRTKEDRDAFKAARDLWKRREMEELDRENQRIQEYVKSKQQADQTRQKKKDEENALKEKIVERVAAELRNAELLRREKEQIIQELHEERQRQAIEQRHREEVEREIRSRLELRKSRVDQLQERADRLRQEAEDDARYKQELIAKLEEDKRLELLSDQKRRMRMIEMRKEVEKMMEEKKLQRAAEMQMFKKLSDQIEQEQQERSRIIEEERIRLLKEHAKNLIGYLPRGVLRTGELSQLVGEEADPAVTK